MDVRQAGAAPPPSLTGEEAAAVVERLRALRRRRDAGDLSTGEYTQLVRGVLERRRASGPARHPERRGAGQDAGST
jgi:hypothetical protein